MLPAPFSFFDINLYIFLCDIVYFFDNLYYGLFLDSIYNMHIYRHTYISCLLRNMLWLAMIYIILSFMPAITLSLCLCLCLCVCVNSWVWFISNIIGLMIISTCLLTVGFVFVTCLEDVEVEDSRRRARAGESKQFHWAATLGIRP